MNPRPPSTQHSTPQASLTAPEAHDRTAAETWVAGAMRCSRCAPLSATPEPVTPWFSGHTCPTRIGWYERLFTDGVYWAYWDGSRWFHRHGPAPHWYQVGDYPCWRGLIERGAPAC